MNEKLLKEYIDRMGLVTEANLAAQTGATAEFWRVPAMSLLARREIFLCRFDHGAETFLSLHALFCLRSVYTEPTLGENAQELYDILSDDAPLTRKAWQQKSELTDKGFALALAELQQKLCVAPLPSEKKPPEEQLIVLELSAQQGLFWLTDEKWMQNMHRPARYNDLEYCLSELKRILKNRFSTREINRLIYQGAL